MVWWLSEGGRATLNPASLKINYKSLYSRYFSSVYTSKDFKGLLSSFIIERCIILAILYFRNLLIYNKDQAGFRYY